MRSRVRATVGARGGGVGARELDLRGAVSFGPEWDQSAGMWTTRNVGDRAIRVLVAEDETIIRLDLYELRTRAGLEVCAEARDGEEAVELARATRPELALMDVRMPRLDGIEAARRILSERPIQAVPGAGPAACDPDGACTARRSRIVATRARR
jgi:CheY-like chemotaxis protein